MNYKYWSGGFQLPAVLRVAWLGGNGRRSGEGDVIPDLEGRLHFRLSILYTSHLDNFQL
ncbi:hypothetical protein QF049_006201 [Paenibacillus sp. W4I10]|uniref:hypothetical protein n=1 Tax=Paenibacillus sp. W4I10 TaxID=3042298 RepID=UPI0027884E4F|nr:hypothetical protein [Paenibacillus sp. W4I10]MDQ0724940.1 hypothetical protein [Paenibacillus sp. W4I10]